MNRICLLALLLSAAAASARASQAPSLASSLAPSLPYVQTATSDVPAAAPSPAEQRIANARRQIAADPKRTQAYNELALASIRRARETANPAFYKDAELALNVGLHLAPRDFELQKTGVALLLGEGRFEEALAKARVLNKQVPDDVLVYGYVAEAAIALGRYPEAEAAAQWMMNLRANNTPALLIAAELRVVWGETPGALQFLDQAFSQTPPIEPEELAWIANRIAATELGAGHLTAASHALARAEELFPGSPVTLENLARLHMAEGKPKESIALLERRLAAEQAQQIPPARTLYLLAMAKQQAGCADATDAFAHFQTSVQASVQRGTAQPEAVNDLILYDAGLPGIAPPDAAAALALAQQAIAVRQDVDTLDAYAWALYANGRYAEAETQIGKALAVGVRRARIYEHAGAIASKLSQPAQAAQQFASALEADPTSPYAAEARRQLGSAAPGPVQTSIAQANTDQPALAPVQTGLPGFSAGVAKSPDAAPVLAQPSVDDAIPLQEVADTGGVPTALLIPRPTGTARAIRKMQALVEAHPKDASAYAGLGAAFFQHARETGDVEDFQLAEQALTRSLDLISDDLAAEPALATMAEVCMGEHRFTDALAYAQKALALGSGDLSPFAIVGDAYADMGDYAKASVAYSRLQPVSSGAARQTGHAYEQHTRTAFLQFVSGDTEGARGAMRTAIREGLVAHLPGENLAWLYFELGEFSFQAGDIQAAANACLTALTIEPGNYRALAGLGKVRAAQGQYQEAITLYQSAIAVVPYPLFVAELADLYTRIGDTPDAERQGKLIEYIGMLGHINQVLHNRDLALFYANHDEKLEEALALAHKEFEVRSDIYTWDTLAWALYKNGKYQEADEAMAHALRLGTKDAMLLFHAGMISARLGHQTQAVRQLDEAMKINPHFQVLDAETALKELSELTGSKRGNAPQVRAALATGPVTTSVGKVHDVR